MGLGALRTVRDKEELWWCTLGEMDPILLGEEELQPLPSRES
jgi:hypothetical protein